MKQEQRPFTEMTNAVKGTNLWEEINNSYTHIEIPIQYVNGNEKQIFIGI